MDIKKTHLVWHPVKKDNLQDILYNYNKNIEKSNCKECPTEHVYQVKQVFLLTCDRWWGRCNNLLKSRCIRLTCKQKKKGKKFICIFRWPSDAYVKRKWEMLIYFLCPKFDKQINKAILIYITNEEPILCPSCTAGL